MLVHLLLGPCQLHLLSTLTSLRARESGQRTKPSRFPVASSKYRASSWKHTAQLKKHPCTASVVVHTITLDETYMITKVLPRKEQMKPVVQVLPSSNSFSRTKRYTSAKSPMSIHFNLKLQHTTHNPIFEPTASINPHACCRCFSSWFIESFPRCLSDMRSASSGVKYGKWYLMWDIGICDGESRAPPC